MTKYKNKYRQLVMGLTNYLPDNKYYRVLFGEIDKEYNSVKLRLFCKMLHTIIGIDHNLVVYKSHKGYHYISLNLYTVKKWKNMLFNLGRFGLLCHNFIAFSLWFNKSTLRITKKFDMETVELIYCRNGTLPKSKPHSEIFSLLLTDRKDSNFISCDGNDVNCGVYWRWYRVKETVYNIADYLPKLVTDGITAQEAITNET